MSVLLARALAVVAIRGAARRVTAQMPRHGLPTRSHVRPAATAWRPPASAVAVAPLLRNASRAPPILRRGGGGGGGGHARRSLTTSRAIPKKAASSYEYDPVRLRASDEFVTEGEEDDDDPYVHMGRPNRSALKRLMEEYKELTKALCVLPKSSLAKIPMPDDVRSEVYATVKISSNIARKRSEGRVTKLLRGLDDDEVLPIQRAVENLQSGVGLLTVAPEVEAAATQWRELLLAGDKETQSAVFGLMQQSDGWNFTRQELGQLVTSAKKEKETAESAREAAAAEKVAAEQEATVMADGTVVPSVKAAPTGKRQKGGAGKSTKKLLKHLRAIAEVANDNGVLR